MQADQQTISRLETLSTEQRNPESMGLSSWTTLELLRCINRQDQTVAVRVADVLGDIAKAVDLIAQRMQQGGRMVYVGTGTRSVTSPPISRRPMAAARMPSPALWQAAAMPCSMPRRRWKTMGKLRAWIWKSGASDLPTPW